MRFVSIKFKSKFYDFSKIPYEEEQIDYGLRLCTIDDYFSENLKKFEGDLIKQGWLKYCPKNVENMRFIGNENSFKI